MNKFRINPKMVVLAREYRGITQEELANKMSITQGYLSKVEKSILIANEDFTDKITQVLDLPIEFFLREGEIYSPNLYYRKKVKTATKYLIKAEAQMNVHRLNIQELLNSIDLKAKPIPLLDIDEYGDPKIIAKRIRQHWNISNGPINNLFELLEKNGIIIVLCDFEHSDISGRSMFTDKKQPIIFINKNEPMDRQRFTASHELSHLIMHIGFSVPESRDIEKEANLFASEFLIPEQELNKQIHGYLHLSELADLKRYWKASMAAILYSSNQNKIITSNNHKRLIIDFNKYGLRMKEPIELEPPIEKPALLQALIKLHLKDLDFTEMELSKILAFNIKEMKEKYFNEDNPKKLNIVVW